MWLDGPTCIDNMTLFSFVLMEDCILQLKSWWLLGKPVWISLAFGYLWVTLSVLANFEIPSSGAILLVACLVAEFTFNNMTWMRIVASFPMGSGKTEKQEGCYEIDGILVSSRGDHPLDPLLAIAKSPHVSIEGKSWSVPGVAESVTKIVHGSIFVSGAVGSLLWAYGHCLFETCGYGW